MTTTNIYALIDPITLHIRYVGKANNVSQRYRAHLNKARKHQAHKLNWINSLKKQKLKPILYVLDVVPMEDWIFWERYWISQVKTWGFDLLNYTTGGDGCTFENQTSFKKGNKSWNEGKGNIKICEICKKEFKINPKGKRTCSKECRSKIKSISVNSGKFVQGEIVWNKGKTGYKTSKRQPVLQFDLTDNFIAEYDCCKTAAEILGCITENIRNACAGRSKTAKGFKWKYKI